MLNGARIGTNLTMWHVRITLRRSAAAAYKLPGLSPADQLRKKNSKTVQLPKGFHPALATARLKVSAT